MSCATTNCILPATTKIEIAMVDGAQNRASLCEDHAAEFFRKQRPLTNKQVHYFCFNRQVFRSTEH